MSTMVATQLQKWKTALQFIIIVLPLEILKRVLQIHPHISCYILKLLKDESIRLCLSAYWCVCVHPLRILTIPLVAAVPVLEAVDLSPIEPMRRLLLLPPEFEDSNLMDGNIVSRNSSLDPVSIPRREEVGALY
jgi:hypothetical protein